MKVIATLAVTAVTALVPAGASAALTHRAAWRTANVVAASDVRGGFAERSHVRACRRVTRSRFRCDIRERGVNVLPQSDLDLTDIRRLPVKVWRVPVFRLGRSVVVDFPAFCGEDSNPCVPADVPYVP